MGSLKYEDQIFGTVGDVTRWALESASVRARGDEVIVKIHLHRFDPTQEVVLRKRDALALAAAIIQVAGDYD